MDPGIYINWRYLHAMLKLSCCFLYSSYIILCCQKWVFYQWNLFNGVISFFFLPKIWQPCKQIKRHKKKKTKNIMILPQFFSKKRPKQKYHDHWSSESLSYQLHNKIRYKKKWSSFVFSLGAVCSAAIFFNAHIYFVVLHRNFSFNQAYKDLKVNHLFDFDL